ncbi:MAG: DUF3048 domain-containing protein [Patescibacteria group bacterium]|jgi:hypothetical protein
MQSLLIYLRQHRTLTISVASALVLVIVGVIGFVVFRADDETFTQTTTTKKETNKQIQRRLDGVLVPAENANTYPIALMIENITASRPQSGLEKARVVYEALAEGGITRFVALFDTTEAIPEIGPVRSARPYFVALAGEYSALYGHVGGSPQAIAEIRNGTKGVIDLDQFFNSAYYWRSTDRFAPHNVYTSADLLTFALRDEGLLDASGEFSPWDFSEDEAKESARGVDAQEITINYSTFSYQTRYVYDRASNTYKRFHAEDPHVMANNTQIAPKNVIVQFAETSVIDEGRLAMNMDDGGEAIVFNNGMVTKGTWEKEDGRTRFLDVDGDEVALLPGQTWVEIVPTDREVDYPQETIATEGV